MLCKEFGKFVVSCDCCEVVLGKYDTFEDAVAAYKLVEWRATKVDGEWQHVCPECQEAGF